jgi:hypothetical protein
MLFRSTARRNAAMLSSDVVHRREMLELGVALLHREPSCAQAVVTHWAQPAEDKVTDPAVVLLVQPGVM